MHEPERMEPAESKADAREQARLCLARRAWTEAYRALAIADQSAVLCGRELESFATCAYLLGRDAEYLKTLERTYQAHLAAGDSERAARAAFWVGLRLLFRGESAQASGWLGRAERCIEAQAEDCLERGYLLVPRAEQALGAANYVVAAEHAARAVTIAQRFGDADLLGLARHLQGRVQVEQGEVERGLCALDEVMVCATAGELSVIVTGLLYCSVIECCQRVYAIERAHEWTRALSAWCEEQPDMVAFSGACRVHRAEILQLQGAWAEAVCEARRACELCQRVNAQATAAAYYQEAEVQRLRGEFDGAERAYRAASQHGLDPQPGLALLRLAQGRVEVAAGAIRRVLNATADSLSRARLLPAYVEILLRAGDVAAARAGSEELARTAESVGSGVLRALALHAQGSVDLAGGAPEVAAAALHRAAGLWQQVNAPYALACTRLCAGLARRALDDEEGAELELDAARCVFERLGAQPDLRRVTALLRSATPRASNVLSPRELEVLRLVASGSSNKAVARALFVSEKTIERHLSNIFCKLDVHSRTAAVAYAHRHQLFALR